MLCLRPEVPEDDFSGSYRRRSSTCSGNDYDTVLNSRVSSSSSTYRDIWRRRRRSKRNRQWSWSFSSNDAASTYNSDMEEKTSGREKVVKTCVYRNQLEQEVKRLQKQLQEEIDLHSTLAIAVEHHNSTTFVESPNKLPDKARDLLDSVALLEIAVGKLEEELEDLQRQLSRERRERHEAEFHPRVSTQRRTSLGLQSVHSFLINQGLSTQTAENWNKEHRCLFSLENLWRNPNRLSEEMVSCMRDIFLFLSDNESSPNASLPHQYYDSPMSSAAKITPTPTPRKTIEVSCLSVGRQELPYGAAALNRFRLLVEQLAKVDPSCMTHEEKIAFWINLYNAMIMHAYLIYGIPKSDIKLFSLMQKATYTVGVHSISAVDIEFIILKMKPRHHPQIALCLSLHKFEEYTIDHHQPLLTFALSCGMHSSPAVRIFTPETLNKQLKESLKDYVRASVGISPKGKVVVPKLLHSYAKGIGTDASLIDWICRFLGSEQADMVRASTSTRVKWRFMGRREVTVVPCDSRFRYLFTLDSS